MPRYQQSKHALGSEVMLTLVVPGKAQAETAFVRLWAMIDAFENRFSRFREDSELAAFNARAGAPTKVSVPFHDLLSTARKMAMLTDGLYNPLILPALQRAGYKGSWPNAGGVTDALNYENRNLASAEDIVITRTAAAIPGDTALDFGGIGKGYLLDQLANVLHGLGIDNYWLSLGGDILCNGLDETNESWNIVIQDAHNSKASAGSICNRGRRLAVATSGITKRKGPGWHHIIDPRTGRSADTDILTATVCSKSATEADVFAKCLVILGNVDSPQFMSQHNLTNVLIQTDAAKNSVLKMGDAWLN